MLAAMSAARLVPVLRRRRLQLSAALLLSLLAGLDPAASRAGEPAADSNSTPTRPLLLELFTSQGCSSCPPADAQLAVLAQRQDVLALAFHVDYWNDLGWVDPFSSAAFTDRQRWYSAHEGLRTYTPQLVVDGREDVIGSDAHATAFAVARAHGLAHTAPARLQRSISGWQLSIGTTTPDPAALADAPPHASVWLVSYDPLASTHILRGENAGRSLDYHNIVRSMRRLGQWQNQPLALNLQLMPGETGADLAVFVQDDTGTVWAVARGG